MPILLGSLALIYRTLLFLLPLIALLTGCSEKPPSQLQQIKTHGEIRIASYNGPTTIYQGPKGQTGFEHDLTTLFAKHLGVKAKFLMAGDNSQLIKLLQQGRTDLAAGLVIKPHRQKRVRFGPAYQAIEQRLIYKTDTSWPKPKKISNLIGSKLAFAANRTLEAQLRTLKKKHPQLSWESDYNRDTEELINRLDRGALNYVIAPSNHFALVRRYHPQLKAGMPLLKGDELAWAFPPGKDDSLIQEAEDFFARIKSNGRLQQLIERYYGHTGHLDTVDLLVFKRHYRERLPQYLRTIKYAAFMTDLDWRLLAATAYQESHWDPAAVSPTGVRGLMMLTRGTAKDIGVTDRTDPQQSILGGARYLKQMKEKLPERIGEPDRTWFALASYNVGFGHLQDARFLALLEKNNPDKWSVIKHYLPRLTEKKWHSQTTYGYARGKEPVHYVDNIRSYYDLLIRFEKN